MKAGIRQFDMTVLLAGEAVIAEPEHRAGSAWRNPVRGLLRLNTVHEQQGLHQ